MGFFSKKKTEQQLRQENSLESNALVSQDGRNWQQLPDTNDLEEFKQFPINFQDGTTIYQQPEKMDSSHGFPVLNTHKYLKNHHPERLEEYEEHLKEFKKRVSGW